MKVILCPREDGGVDVVVPVKNTYPHTEDISEDGLVERAMKGVLNKSAAVVVDDSIIPRDRTFRNAWKLEGGSIAHDMEKCREIHRSRMRLAREPLFAALDIEFMRANETGEAVKRLAVVKKKQELRDVTADPRIEAAKTPEELKAVWPECLK